LPAVTCAASLRMVSSRGTRRSGRSHWAASSESGEAGLAAEAGRSRRRYSPLSTSKLIRTSATCSAGLASARWRTGLPWVGSLTVSYAAGAATRTFETRWCSSLAGYGSQISTLPAPAGTSIVAA
jgi:hypothetical protein